MNIIGDFTKRLGFAALLFEASANIYDRAMNEGHEKTIPLRSARY